MTIDDLYPGDIFEADNVLYFVTRSWTGKPFFVSEWEGYTESQMVEILKDNPIITVIRYNGSWCLY